MDSQHLFWGPLRDGQTFSGLKEFNKIFFRVHKRDQIDPIHGLVADAFKRSAGNPSLKHQLDLPSWPDYTHEEVMLQFLKYQQWRTYAGGRQSKFLSGTFNIRCAMWYCLKERKWSRDEEVFISIVDAQSGYLRNPRLAIEVLEDVCCDHDSKSPRLDECGRAQRFARAHQEVLIYGNIPHKAIICVFPWSKVEAFLAANIPQSDLQRVGDWGNANRYDFGDWNEDLVNSQKGEGPYRQSTVRGAAHLAACCFAALISEHYKEWSVDELKERIVDLAECTSRWIPECPHPWTERRLVLDEHVQADAVFVACTKLLELVRDLRRIPADQAERIASPLTKLFLRIIDDRIFLETGEVAQ